MGKTKFVGGTGVPPVSRTGKVTACGEPALGGKTAWPPLSLGGGGFLAPLLPLLLKTASADKPAKTFGTGKDCYFLSYCGRGTLAPTTVGPRTALPQRIIIIRGSGVLAAMLFGGAVSSGALVRRSYFGSEGRRPAHIRGPALQDLAARGLRRQAPPVGISER